MSEPKEDRMPALFIGHGSPMNAIEKNEFSDMWALLGKTLPKPKSILCISAHWESNSTEVTSMPNPKTIHDFGGFPKELYEVQYPAPGNPELAIEVVRMLTKFEITSDQSWGLDHGCWSVLKSMYPKADIPIVQLSLDRDKSPSEHYELAKELAFLRENKVLIIGSGNIVHNLGLIDWENAGGAEWAIIANTIIKDRILAEDHHSLINYSEMGSEMRLAIPTREHYLPLLYIMALKQKDETLSFFNDKLVMGSLSMTSVMIGGKYSQAMSVKVR